MTKKNAEKALDAATQTPSKESPTTDPVTIKAEPEATPEQAPVVSIAPAPTAPVLVPDPTPVVAPVAVAPVAAPVAAAPAPAAPAPTPAPAAPAPAKTVAPQAAPQAGAKPAPTQLTGQIILAFELIDGAMAELKTGERAAAMNVMFYLIQSLVFTTGIAAGGHEETLKQLLKGLGETISATAPQPLLAQVMSAKMTKLMQPKKPPGQP